uniref:Uncharacterized protein n=1 Tax=Callorhinchus milii TaxID=7868 RepID=A0A4W3K0Z8_CALMI
PDLQFSSLIDLVTASILASFKESVSLTSSPDGDVDDRISYLEQRLHLQEDEIQVLRAALADVVRRLTVTEEQCAALGKKTPTRAH